MDLVWSIDFQFYSPLLVTDDPNAVLCDDSAFFFCMTEARLSVLHFRNEFIQKDEICQSLKSPGHDSNGS